MLPEREGAWLLTLGIEIDGDLDAAPLLADLLRRDARWLNAQQMAAIEDIAIIPAARPGKRIEAPAGRSRPSWVPWWTAHRPTRKQRRKATHCAWARRKPAASRPCAPGWCLAHRVGTVNGWSNDWQLQGDGPASRAPALHRHAPAGGRSRRGCRCNPRPTSWKGRPGCNTCAPGLGGILADDMGLGKTAQALAHVLTEKRPGRLSARRWWCCPPRCSSTGRPRLRAWRPACACWRCMVPTIAKRYPHIADHDLVLTTYPLLWRDVDALVAALYLLILDEAQMVKTLLNSRSARALRKLQVSHLLCLTGTPLENHLGRAGAV